MFRRLLGTAIATAAAALGVKVVKDILEADEEEEKKIIELETEESDIEELLNSYSLFIEVFFV